jgi:hypothetical protein
MVIISAKETFVLVVGVPDGFRKRPVTLGLRNSLELGTNPL